ncbi:MAG: PDZ domain-containing protein [Ginsengibacter sp.]
MKKIIIPGFITACITLSSVAVFAQKEKDKSDKKVSKEIIIRKDGDKDSKMKIEIDGDNVTVNGKPLSEYKDGDVTVIERDRTNRGSGNFLYSPGNDNMNFEVFKHDAANGKPHTFMGVVTDKSTDGVKINEVMKGSSAEKAGLKVGDIITKIDNKDITSPSELMDAVRAHKPNDEVKVYYKRDGKKNDMKLKLGESKQSSQAFVFNSDRDFKNGSDFNFSMPPMPKIQGFKNQNFSWNMSNRVKLGVKVEDTQDNSGAKILSVEEGSPAEKAGLKKDDIITEINGEKVNDVNNVRSRLMGSEDKENFTLKAKRNNAEMNFDVKIPKPVNSADL